MRHIYLRKKKYFWPLTSSLSFRINSGEKKMRQQLQQQHYHHQKVIYFLIYVCVFFCVNIEI